MIEPVKIGDATLITADVIEGLRSLPADSVQCVVTSVPYWGLRDYFKDHPELAHLGIGLEPTFQEWLDKMVAVCEEIKRVLRPDGTFWLNCGDGYAGNCSRTSGGRRGMGVEREAIVSKGLEICKPKDLLMMPARLAIALQEAGWWLRSEIIWAKPNPMPESVTDRPTSSHEKIYLLTKSSKYFYDADAVRIPYKESSIERLSQPNFDNQTGGPKDPKTGNRSHRKVLENLKRRKPAGWDTELGSHGTLRHNQPKHTDSKMGGGSTGFKGHSGNFDSDGNLLGDPRGRNLRNVWTIATQPYPEAHFATFPEGLPMKCIMAGSSERGCCPECGAPWVRIVEKTGGSIGAGWHDHSDDSGHGQISQSGSTFKDYKIKTLGWEPSCECKHHPHDGPMIPYPPIPCTVLDPFSGSATTGLVALKLNRRYIGIELNPEYTELGRRRIQKEADQGKLFR